MAEQEKEIFYSGENEQESIICFSYYDDLKQDTISWMFNKKVSDFAILATNSEKVHTEAKILDFLLAIDWFEQGVIVEISKACCLHCYDMIDVVNYILQDKFKEFSSSAYIKVTGAHLHIIDNLKNGKKPDFFFLLKIEDCFMARSHYTIIYLMTMNM